MFVVSCLLLIILAQLSHQWELRNITDFNLNWLFHSGDASGADGTSFADASWRSLSVPHDWVIEGPNPPANPFLSSAPTTGYSAYAPSGISWYRKHFSLTGTPNTQKIYIEFDGVMQDASFYVNGKTIATHPYGYTSIQYDITSVTFTGDNVIAVKTDTSKQPAERFYKGAGIYRDVRLVVTNPVHIDQYGLYVSTPKVSSTTATVRVQVTVLNRGSSNMANASVNGVLSDPSDIAPAPVTATETQDVAAGARATFTFDVPVSNPALWNLGDDPPLYSLAATVSVGGIAVDDDSTNTATWATTPRTLIRLPPRPPAPRQCLEQLLVLQCVGMKSTLPASSAATATIPASHCTALATRFATLLALVHRS